MSILSAIKLSVSLSPQEEAQITKAFQAKLLQKGDFFIEAGQYCHHVAFVNSGKLRVYYHDDEGNEVTCYFVPEGQFISSFTSFLTQTPTKEHIASLEESELLIIHRTALEKLCEQIPKLQIWRRNIAENLFIMMERRIALLQSHAAQARYEMIMQENPDLILKVPLQYTASFLGITPQHLSRLRKQTS